MKNLKGVLWGIILVGIGIILGLNTLNITNIDIFFAGWWSLFIIVPCFINLFTESDHTGNLIGLLIGVMLLLSSQDIIDFAIFWKLLVPVVLIIWGASLIFKDTFRSKFNEEIKKISQKANKDNEYCATFSEQKVNFDNEKFEGANLSAVFGGVKCDLRNAILKKDTVINVTAVFGGVDIYVPENVLVKVKSTSIFGGVEEKKKNNTKDKKNQVIIYINATCVFGGVEINE